MDCMPYMHANGHSTERNFVVEIMWVLNLNVDDFRLRDKLIMAGSPWLDAERKAAASPSWQDRPTGPGLWLFFDDENMPATIMVKDAKEVAAWPNARSRVGRVFGPIPADEGK